jgi:soluble lytic murein transglycosylase-like protein
MTNAEWQQAEKYLDFVFEAAQAHRIDPFIILGIGSRETFWGALWNAGPDIIGDNGNGYGLMQADKRYHKEHIESGDWKDPKKHIDYCTGLLRWNFNYFHGKHLVDPVLTRCAIASYNASFGRVLAAVLRADDPDSVTTGRNYSADVLRRAAWYRDKIGEITDPDLVARLDRLPLMPIETLPFNRPPVKPKPLPGLDDEYNMTREELPPAA